MRLPSLCQDQAYHPVASYDDDNGDEDDTYSLTQLNIRQAVWLLPTLALIALSAGALSFSGRTNMMNFADDNLDSTDDRLTMVASTALNHMTHQHSIVDIVHIVLDDVGKNDMWATRDLITANVTPRITALARRGLILSNYYGQSYCTPARAAMLTGKFVHKLGFSGDDARGGQVEIKALSNFSLPIGHRLVPEVLRSLGYATHGIGKWNIGHCHDDYLPWRRGFDTFLGYFSSGIHYVTHLADTVSTQNDGLGHIEINSTSYPLVDLQIYDGSSVQVNTAYKRFGGVYSTTIFTQEATSRLDAATSARRAGMRTKPSYIWLAYHGMHDDDGVEDLNISVDADSFIASIDSGATTDVRAAFARGLRVIDSGVGMIADALDRLVEVDPEQTSYLLVLHSDNGGFPCASHCAGNNMPFRGLKFFDFDGALRVPAFVYSPQLLATTRDFTPYTKLMHHVDWLATFAQVAGGNIQTLLSSDDFDSTTHWPYFLSTADGRDGNTDDYTPRDQIIFSVDDASATLRVGRFKLLVNRSVSGFYHTNSTTTHCLRESRYHFLFDIEDDPWEVHNLWNDPDYEATQLSLLSLATQKYDTEFFLYPHPRGDSLTSDVEAAIQNSTSDSTKVLVAWGCAIVGRSSAASLGKMPRR